MGEIRGEVCKKVTDGTHNPPPNSGEGKQVISAINIKNNKIDFSLSNRFVTDEQFEKEDKRTEIRRGDVLLTVVGTLGAATVVETDKQFTAQRSLAILKPMIVNYYLLNVVESPMFNIQINNNAKGTTQKGIYLKKLTKLLIPLPPLKEQSRIAAKIAELFALLRKVESSNQQYDKFKKILRSKVLDLAMRGKLVEQNPDDEPASVLLEKIKTEKAELVKEGKIKKSKSLPEITDEKYIDISKDKIASRARQVLDENDILFSLVRPYLKNIAMVPENSNYKVGSTGFYVLKPFSKLNKNYIFYLVLSTYVISSMTKLMKGDNSPSIRKSDLQDLAVPIPPLKRTRENSSKG
ncbi:restriction endonuclease subunit S [Lactobacillus sp. PSON]|uniref:restriction endonuclease subunit S n=1 Tax=Lactobacillus sp. PSON TaxID=3455454 RepID=UPI004042123E